MLTGLPGVPVEHRCPDHLGRPYPTAFIRIDPTTGLTGAAVIDALLAGDPPVAIMDVDDRQVVRADVRVLSDPPRRQVAARLRDLLTARWSAG